MSDLVERASLAAQEMRDENQNGWPNLVDELAARIEALEAEVAALKPAPPSVEHITGVALKEPKRGTTWVCEKPKRHHDVFAMMENEGANPFCDSPHDCQQGFHTSTGRFVTRLEAMPIAKAAGQLIRPERGGYQGPELFSEDLW